MSPEQLVRAPEPAPAPADPHPTSGATVVIEVHGEVEGTALVELRALLAALEPAPNPVVVDVSAASSSTTAALTVLCRFRAARRAAELDCTLRGLHEGIAPALEHVALTEVFAVWAETHRL